MKWMKSMVGVVGLGVLTGAANGAEEFPPGWLPVSPLAAEEPSWSRFREIEDRVHLYLPNGEKPVRGVFLCYVFHSGDPRELARLWDFALVTLPRKLEYDLGHNDKRTGRFKEGRPLGNMGFFLRYLEEAAKATGHQELTTVPIVGWVGQNGSHLAADLLQRAPGRVLAWSDSFGGRLRNYPELTASVPFPFAWEISKKELREGVRNYRKDETFPADLSCRANTYGFSHGIYSKFNFFMAYLDRCIRLRMPDEMPASDRPVVLKPVVRARGWVGDYDPITEWAPIAPASDAATKSYKYPCWMPDEYAAWMWRSYHSAQPSVKLTGPVVEYRKKDGKWGGPECGLGYGGELSASDTHTFSATAKAEFVKIEFRSGNRVLGTATKSPWTVEGVMLEPGLHALFAVGVSAEGKSSVSRPAFVIVE